jgi:hypothetical protein
MTRNIEMHGVNKIEQSPRLSSNTMDQLKTLLLLRKAQLSESAERTAQSAIVQTLLDNFRSVAA